MKTGEADEDAMLEILRPCIDGPISDAAIQLVASFAPTLRLRAVGAQILESHRTKPGPQPDVQHREKIADAAIWARSNVHDDDEERAAKDATRQCGLSAKAWKAVFRAAFERKDPPMNELIRRRASPRESLKG